MHGYSKFNDKNFQSRWDDKSTQGQIIFQDSQGREDVSFPNKEEQYNTTMTNQVLTKLGEDTRTNYMANPVSTPPLPRKSFRVVSNNKNLQRT
jgi:hypothetical protein